VQVLDGKDQRMILAFPNKQITHGLEDPVSPLLGLELEIFLILHLEGKDVLERG
jgi:hypothetical protein